MKNYRFFRILILVLISPSINSQSALNFDGIDDYIEITNNGFEANNMTIQLWVNPSIGQVDYADIISTHTSEGNGGFVIEMSGNIDNEYIFAWGGTGAYQRGPTFLLEPNIWQQLTVVKEGSNNRVYINGRLVTSDILDPDITSGTGKLYLGKWAYTSARFWKGSIDELRIWNRALSSSEINQNYKIELPANFIGLKLYLKFDEGLPNSDNGSGCPNTTPCINKCISEVNQNYGTLYNFTLDGLLSNWIHGGVMKCVTWQSEYNDVLIAQKQLTALQGGVNNYWNAGASSVDFLPENTSGYIEYKVHAADLRSQFIIGLNENSFSNSYEEILYGIALQQHAQENYMQLDVFEAGDLVSKYKRKVKLGDVIRIVRNEDNSIHYEWESNGVNQILKGQRLSAKSNSNKLVADCSIKRYEFNITNVMLSSSWQ